jgi:diguanylate cyclase (GGDEF)-like protein
LVATLGAAATSANGAQAVVQGVLQQLAGICRTSAELWEMTNESASAAPRWRLRASYGTQLPWQHRAGNEQPTSQIVQAATTLRTIDSPDPHATLAIPILAFGRLQGILQLAAPQSSTDLAYWRRDLEHFAPVLGLYLHAAELNEALASGVLRDRLTGIANQAQLHDHLERELARARRTRRPFALLMIAPDHFDALRANLGLPLRDRVMQALAVMLRDACRNGDIIGRYGADRFLVVLPDSTSQGAQQAAQRYLAHFYRRPITLPEGTPHYLDVSIGIALFPVDGAMIGELVESAALALREAQRLGGKRAIAA